MELTIVHLHREAREERKETLFYLAILARLAVKKPYAG
jgi:hypothetical protein